MKSQIFKAIAICLGLATGFSAQAQFNLGKAVKAGSQAVKGLTLTDKQMAQYVKESVDWMDANNPVAGPDDPYTIRLNRLTEDLNDANGIPLNFKVYIVRDINAFACADGSVRVFSSLMDIMSDDELLGIIGHEIGHVAMHHSKNAFKTELLTGTLKDAVGSTGGTAAALTDSQLGSLGQSLVNARYSQKQEKEADNYGYDFLKSNGKNPWGMVMAFEKFQNMESQSDSDSKSSYINKMFSSHPETSARIKAMTDRCNKDKIARPESETASK